MREVVQVNRAPVLTLWAAVVAERIGYDPEAALSIGKTVAGLNAQSKGRSLGIYKPAERKGGPPKVPKPGVGESFAIEVMGRTVPMVRTGRGVRAVCGDRPVEPESVTRYLEEKFGEALNTVRGALRDLAASMSPEKLAAAAYELYERFRPAIPSGVHGWGAKGDLDLDLIRSLASKTGNV
jgi:hypothetical protein